MTVTVEISYYPMTEDFESVILSFIDRISTEGIDVQVGRLSTVMVGEYSTVMNTLQHSMHEFMEKYTSVYNIKISNYQKS